MPLLDTDIMIENYLGNYKANIVAKIVILKTQILNSITIKAIIQSAAFTAKLNLLFGN